MAFTKLDSGITDSTIWQAPDATRIVWITMLAMADKNGYIGASMPGLAGRARVSLEACIAAVATFMAPDEWSRTQDFEGRRIAEAEGGWVLLNHAKYRAAEDAEKRRERSRIAMAKLRERRRAALTVNQSSQSDTRLPQADTEADTEAEATKTALADKSADSADFDSFYAAYPRKMKPADARKAWKQTAKDRPPLPEVMAGLERCKASREWQGDGGKFIQYPATWLRAHGWASEPTTQNGRPVLSPADADRIANDKARDDAETNRAYLLGLLDQSRLPDQAKEPARKRLRSGTFETPSAAWAVLREAGLDVMRDEIVQRRPS